MHNRPRHRRRLRTTARKIGCGTGSRRLFALSDGRSASAQRTLGNNAVAFFEPPQEQCRIGILFEEDLDPSLRADDIAVRFTRCQARRVRVRSLQSKTGIVLTNEEKGLSARFERSAFERCSGAGHPLLDIGE